MSIKLGANEIRFIALFQKITGATVKDCIIDDNNNKVTFVVKQGDMGLAIGKRGVTVSKVKKAVDRGVEVIELNDDPCEFIRNVLSPAELHYVRVMTKDSGEKIATVTTDNTNKRIAIGKKGINIERAKLLANRLHDIDNIIIK